MNLPFTSLPDLAPPWLSTVLPIAGLLFLATMAVPTFFKVKHRMWWPISGFAVLSLVTLYALDYQDAHKEAWEQAAHDTDQAIAETYELPEFRTTRQGLFGTKQGAMVCTHPLGRPVAKPASWAGGQGLVIFAPAENGCAVTVIDSTGYPIQAAPSL